MLNLFVEKIIIKFFWSFLSQLTTKTTLLDPYQTEVSNNNANILVLTMDNIAIFSYNKTSSCINIVLHTSADEIFITSICGRYM